MHYACTDCNWPFSDDRSLIYHNGYNSLAKFTSDDGLPLWVSRQRFLTAKQVCHRSIKSSRGRNSFTSSNTHNRSLVYLATYQPSAISVERRPQQQEWWCMKHPLVNSLDSLDKMCKMEAPERWPTCCTLWAGSRSHLPAASVQLQTALVSKIHPSMHFHGSLPHKG